MSLVDDVSMSRAYRAKRGALWDALFSHPRAHAWLSDWCPDVDAEALLAASGSSMPRAFEEADERGCLVRSLARRALTSAPSPPCSSKRWAQYQSEVRLAWKDFVDVRGSWASQHTGLTIWLLKRYRHPLNAYDDLVQDGHEGLMHALDKYDPEHGTRFCTYAAWWIRNGILDGIERSREVHIPEKCRQLLSHITVASETLLNRGERPSAEALAAELGRPLEAVQVALRAPRMRRSAGSTPWASERGNPEAAAGRTQLVEQIRKEAGRLEERERQVIVRHFGLGGFAPRTLAQVGSELGVSGERARQIQVEGLTRLERVLSERQAAV